MKCRTTVKRMLCILLCIAMLPVVKASATSYRDAYNILAAIAKKGQANPVEFEEEGKMTFYSNETMFNGFHVNVAHRAAEKLEDYVVIEYYYFSPEDAHACTTLFLYEGDEQAYYTCFRHSISGPNAGGKLDSYGFYGSQGYISLSKDYTFSDELDFYDYSALVPRERFEADFKKELRGLLEFLDCTLRSKNVSLGVQSIFPNISPKSIHNVGKTWVERAATCTVDGSTGYQCSACGAAFYEPIKAHHNWTLTRVDVPATDVHGSGLYTCSSCGSTKTDAICISSAFADMPAYTNWAHPGIDWAVYNKITNGTSASTFAPNQGCTRAQVVTFLWRAAGSPAPETLETPFLDVKSGAFYDKAVAWAVEHNITSGTDSTHFSPDATCTRGQIVTFLYRAAGSPALDAAPTGFADVPAGKFYETPVQWAVAGGITKGTDETHFSPDSTCTRAQVVTFLYRAQ